MIHKLTLSPQQQIFKRKTKTPPHTKSSLSVGAGFIHILLLFIQYIFR